MTGGSIRTVVMVFWCSCAQVRQRRGVRGLLQRRPAPRLRHAELGEAGEDVLQRFHRPLAPRQEDGIRSARRHHQVDSRPCQARGGTSCFGRSSSPIAALLRVSSTGGRSTWACGWRRSGTAAAWWSRSTACTTREASETTR